MIQALAYGVTKGYTPPSETWVREVDTQLNIWDTAGTLNKLDRMFIACAETVEWALIDILNASDATLATRINSCTFVAGSGFEGNGGAGDSMRIGTNFNPSTGGFNYTLNSASRGIYLYKANSAGNNAVTSSIANNDLLRNGSSTQHRINSGASLSVSVNLSGTGLLSVVRTSSNDVNFFKDKTKSVRTQASSAIANGNNQILSNLTTSFSDAGFSFYYIGGALTDADVEILYDGFVEILTNI
jgi:hypothetical protein